MFKRVSIVLTLLFTNIAMAQTATSVPNALSGIDDMLEQPVVTVSSATGTNQDIGLLGTSTVVLPPAEVSTTTASTSSSTLVITGFGASSTSSTTTVSTTTSETEESTETNSADEEKLFDLVYAGFQEFVRLTLGWE